LTARSARTQNWLKIGSGANPKTHGEEAMKYIRTILIVVCFLVVGGAIGAARAGDQGAGDQGVTLYTPALGGQSFSCTAVNVSDKTLGITFAILGNTGQELSCDSPNTCTRFPGGPPITNPTPELQVLQGAEVELFVALPTGSAPIDGYCAVSVSGTGNRNNVRVLLSAALVYTFPGTTIPTVLLPLVEGH
jgi:hypothetical protein